MEKFFVWERERGRKKCGGRKRGCPWEKWDTREAAGACFNGSIDLEGCIKYRQLPSLEISEDFQAFDGMTQKILNLKVLWIHHQ